MYRLAANVVYSWMKEILFRNMRNGCLRQVADQPAFQRIQRVASKIAFERQYSTSSMSSMDSLGVQEAILDMKEEIRATNKRLLKLTEQLNDQKEMLKQLIDK